MRSRLAKSGLILLVLLCNCSKPLHSDASRLDDEEMEYLQEFSAVTDLSKQCRAFVEGKSDWLKYHELKDDPAIQQTLASLSGNIKKIRDISEAYLPRVSRTLPPQSFVGLHNEFIDFLFFTKSSDPIIEWENVERISNRCLAYFFSYESSSGTFKLGRVRVRLQEGWH